MLIHSFHHVISVKFKVNPVVWHRSFLRFADISESHSVFTFVLFSHDSCCSFVKLNWSIHFHLVCSWAFGNPCICYVSYMDTHTDMPMTTLVHACTTTDTHTHTYYRTNSHTHTQSHMHNHTCTITHAQSHMRNYTCTITHNYTNTTTHTHNCSHIPIHSQNHTHSQTHTSTHTHNHTHNHTHTTIHTQPYIHTQPHIQPHKHNHTYKPHTQPHTRTARHTQAPTHNHTRTTTHTQPHTRSQTHPCCPWIDESSNLFYNYFLLASVMHLPSADERTRVVTGWSNSSDPSAVVRLWD